MYARTKRSHIAHSKLKMSTFFLQSPADSGPTGPQSISGELQVKGASVFKRYHNHPKDTAKEFTKDKWYMTGDMVEFVRSDGSDGYDGAYKILGNLNVDLIK